MLNTDTRATHRESILDKQYMREIHIRRHIITAILRGRTEEKLRTIKLWMHSNSASTAAGIPLHEHRT
jgi:hypothetical protein